MKNKKLLWGLLLALLCGLGYSIYTFVIAPTKSLQPIYVIPKDAIYFMETEEPIENWAQISSSTLWNHLKGNSYFSELTENANSLDTLFHENKRLFELLGSRSLMVSAHMFKKNDYDFLFVVDLQKISKLTRLNDYLNTLFDKDYKIHRRTYNAHEIIEIYDKESKETLTIALLENLLVASYTSSLTEASIDQYTLPVIGRDLHYQEVRKKVGQDDMFRLFIQQQYLDDFANCYMNTANEYLQYLSNTLWYSGFSLELEQDLVIAEGYTNINEEHQSYLQALQESGTGKRSIANIAPQRTAFYLSLGFDSFEEFYKNFLELQQDNPETFKTYQESITKIEQFLKIDIQKNFINWIDDEIAFLQLQSSALGKKNEFAIVLKAADEDEASENLNYILKQIKKKTPVKFREVTYKGYPIKFMAIKGFFKLILGKFFKGLEKPYFITIDHYVIFSNHPQTLKNFINDYEAKRTLAAAPDYAEFNALFERHSNFFTYINMPLLHKNIKGFVDPKTRSQLEKNKKYITCFPQIGFQLTPSGSLFETKLVLQYQDPKEQVKKVQFIEKPGRLLAAKYGPQQHNENTDSATSNHHLLEMVQEQELISIAEISPDDLNAKKYTETYEDGVLKVEVPLKNGMKHGTYRAYHPNGTIRLKGRYRKDKQVGVWKAYDREGNQLERKRY